jgi:hypothetical protein
MVLYNRKITNFDQSLDIPLCNLDFNTSAGIATSQLNNPAVPPAKIVLHGLNLSVLKI